MRQTTNIKLGLVDPEDIASFQNPFNGNMEKIDTEVDKLGDDIYAVNNRVDNVSTKNDQQDQKIDQINNSIDTLGDRITSNYDAIAQTNNDIEIANDRISTNEGNIRSLDSRVSDAATKIKRLETTKIQSAELQLLTAITTGGDPYTIRMVTDWKNDAVTCFLGVELLLSDGTDISGSGSFFIDTANRQLTIYMPWDDPTIHDLTGASTTVYFI